MVKWLALALARAARKGCEGRAIPILARYWNDIGFGIGIGAY